MIELAAVFGVVLAIIALFGGVVWLAEHKAKAELLEEQRREYDERLRKAIEADSLARERIARGELLQNDGHRRD
jgi:hypothetical protein